MPKILFSTPILGHPPIGGPRLRIENSIKALSQIADLYIHCRSSLESIGGAEAVSFYQRYCRKFYLAPLLCPIWKHLNFGRIAANIMSRRILNRNVFSLISDEGKGFSTLLDLADEIGADVIWLGYGNISYPLLKYIKSKSSYRVVLDTDSVWSRFVLRSLHYVTDEKERESVMKEVKEKEEEERWGTQLADVTTAVSEVDAQYYRSLARSPGQVHLFSNVIDVETYGRTPPAHDVKKPCMYLAGSFFSPQSPMVDAARWVVTSVLPEVRRRIPDVFLYIIGKGSKETLTDLNDPRIVITGEVPSVLPYLCHADVAIVPLRFESGTRFKILEAGACGVPVVSTTLGAEGLPVTHQKDILIADEPQAFADAILNILNNPGLALELAQNLREFVINRYSVDSLAEEGRRILEYLLDKS